MKDNTSDRRTTFLLLCLYMALSLALFGYYQHIHSKDEVNYISIGEKLARGDFLNGPNAYWGPALPLLIAGFLRLGLPSIIAAKIACVLVGAVAFFAIRALSHRLVMTEGLRGLLLFLSVPAIVAGAYSAVNTDLMLASLLLLYFSLVFDPAYPQRPRAGWLCGALGAAAYLTKGFGFAFFLAHFTLFTIVHCTVNKTTRLRRGILANFGRGLLIFCGVALAWGFVLNRKYHDPRVWIGISGAYNYAIRGPAFQPLGAPSTYAGFVRPPEGAVSIWEEPYYFLVRTETWSAFDSLWAFRQQVKLVRDSVVNILAFYGTFSAFWAAIVLGCLLLCIGPASDVPGKFALVAALATLGLYTAFYAALYSEERYMWPMGFLMLIMGGSILHLLLKTPLCAGTLRQALIVFAFSSSFLLHPVNMLVSRANKGRALYRLSERLRADRVGGRIASDGDYGASVVMAYHLGAVFYGHAKPGMSEAETITELRRHEVRYYLAWDERTPPVSSILHRINAFTEGERQLTLYAVGP